MSEWYTFDKQRRVPFIINAFHPANPVATPGKFIRTNGFKCVPARRSTSALNVSSPTRSKSCVGLAFLRSVRLPQSRCVVTATSATAGCAPAADGKLARGTSVGFLITVLNRQTAADQRVKARQLAVFGNRHKKFMSLACRSISFCGGIATVVLNLRGK